MANDAAPASSTMPPLLLVGMRTEFINSASKEIERLRPKLRIGPITDRKQRDLFRLARKTAKVYARYQATLNALEAGR